MFYIEVEDDGTGIFDTPKVIEMDETLLAMLITLRADPESEGQETYEELREDLKESLGINLIDLLMYEFESIENDLHTKGMYWNADEQGYVAVSYKIKKAKKTIKKAILKEAFEGEEW